MQEENRKAINLVLRYIFLLVLGMNLWFIYYLFTPLTVKPVIYILKLIFTDAATGAYSIMLGPQTIKIIESCVSGAAYYLITVLNFTTPMAWTKRVFSLLISYFIFLFANIIRIVLSGVFFISEFELFTKTHLIFWYFLSTVLIALIWINSVKILKITAIPAYSDLKFLLLIAKRKKKKS